MARFAPRNEVTQAQVASTAVATKRFPFQNVYGCAEGDMIYINMEAVDALRNGMTCVRDIALIVDISGSMKPYYVSGDVTSMISTIVDSLAWADDDGLDVYFFANGLVFETNIKDANGVKEAVDKALLANGAMGSTMPTPAFDKFTKQCMAKKRAGTVLFLTDGMMDDAGKELQDFYRNVLHTQFKTRDQFYCYAIEFGRSAFGALNKLDGLYAPEQGPEDLFDLDSADHLGHIAEVLQQVGGMSAVGSETVSVDASVDADAKIDMVNTDLIEGGMSSISGLINQVMSFRVRAKGPFTMQIKISGYDDMVMKVTPSGVDVKVEMQ